MVQPSNLRFISEAALAANQAAQDTSLAAHESRIDDLEVLGGLTPGNTSDATVHALLTNPATDTAKAIYSGIPVSAGNAPYSADPTGVVDATSALNAAAAAALAKGPSARLFIPAGTYKISGTVTVACGLDGTGATLNYSGTGTALVLGTNTSGASTARQKFEAPRVINVSRTTGWDGTSIGIYAVNLNACDLYVPFVQDFEKGLVMFGKGAGVTYNTVRIGALWDNHKNLVLDSDATGYSNQMVFIGGRINQTMTKGATADDVNANQISMIGASGGPAAGNNLFLNTSVETNGVAYNLVDLNGRYNQFINCRWEVPNGVTGRIKYGAGAQYNKIIGGYDAEKLVETFTFPGLGGGTIEDGLGAYATAGATAGQAIPHNAWTAINSWTTPTTRRVAYDATTGNFTPRAGRWRINATVAFAAGAATQVRARLLANGGSADIDEKVGSASVRNALKLSTVKTFDGTGVFRVEALQVQGTGTAAQNLETAAPYVNITADYLGV